ncbi:TraB/GumN family protein [Phenylobacterium sp.]|uniref:TraB/GumN family protein n=1 Tax=Phenylobacterium sp. TaxID=1871053 RepID=UPI0035B17C2D
MWKSLAAAAALAFAAAPALAQPPVWVVSDADSQLMLFGSVHVLPPGLDWRPPALEKALKGADDVWFELPVDATTDQEVSQLAAAHGFLPPDKSLTAMLSPEAAQRLVRICQAFNLSMAQIDRLEPWLAEVALAGATYKASGADTATGVEKTLAAEAPPTAQRRAFETPAQQIALFDGAPLDEQIASLEQSLEEIEDDPGAYDKLVNAWMRADVAALDTEALEPLREASPDLFDRLVTARNAAWTRALDQRLKGSGRTVVVVGVGHLIGKDGVPARLRALGYSVKGP